MLNLGPIWRKGRGESYFLLKKKANCCKRIYSYIMHHILSDRYVAIDDMGICINVILIRTLPINLVQNYKMPNLGPLRSGLLV